MKNLILCFLLSTLVIYSGVSQANGFQEVNNFMKIQLESEGLSSDTYKPDAPSASALRNYLANSCFYHRKVNNYGGAYDTYTEILVFHNNGSFSYLDSRNFSVYSQGGNANGYANKAPITGKWNAYYSKYDQTVAILRTDAGAAFPYVLNSYDSGAISFLSNGQITRYRKLPIHNC